MFLDYVALALLVLGVTAMIYLLIYIHDIPHMVAKKRNHPQSEAIHVACWLSLFTLHALWPLVFIWAVSKPPKVELSAPVGEGQASTDLEQTVRELQASLQAIQEQLAQLMGKGA